MESEIFGPFAHILLQGMHEGSRITIYRGNADQKAQIQKYIPLCLGEGRIEHLFACHQGRGPAAWTHGRAAEGRGGDCVGRGGGRGLRASYRVAAGEARGGGGVGEGFGAGEAARVGAGVRAEPP